MARIIVAGYVVRLPVGGYQSWMLQWVLGLHRLGHDVYLVEKAGWPNSCCDPATWTYSDDCRTGAAAVDALFTRFGLANRWCFVDAAGDYHGLPRPAVREVFQTADVFLDFLRRCEWAEESSRVPCRVLMDGEPGFTQMKLELRPPAAVDPVSYNYHYTVGLNVGTPASTTPTAGRTWRPIVDPVLLDLFPVEPPPPSAAFTTVMSWTAHRLVEYHGVSYGQKDVEFPKFFDLPRRTSVPLELALAGRAPVEDLRAAGWRLRNAPEVTVTFDAWRDYIRSSLGEFSIAKNVFVATNSGFFSDRTACYLASGRPAVMQETGFSAHLPCGEGLFAFRTVEEAAAALEEIRRDYARHSNAALDIACEYLDAKKVLGRFLEELGMPAQPQGAVR
jgi:hypothetical protein